MGSGGGVHSAWLVLAMIVLLFIFAAIRDPLLTVLIACLLCFAGNALEVLLDAAVGDAAWTAENRNAVSANTPHSTIQAPPPARSWDTP